MDGTVRMRTVKLLGRFLWLLVDEGNISVAECHTIMDNLKYLAEKGELKPAIMPKLLTSQEAADMLNIGLSNFKRLETAGAFPFKRKHVGSSVRFRNLDVIRYMEAD